MTALSHVRTFWVTPYQQSTMMPTGANVLGSGDGGRLFAIVDPLQPEVARLISVVSDDYALGGAVGQYVGSYQYGGGYMHIFDGGEAA